MAEVICVVYMTAVTGSVFPKQQTLQHFLSPSSLESNQNSPVQPGVYNGLYELLSSMLISFLVYFFCLETDSQEKGRNLFSWSVCCFTFITVGWKHVCTFGGRDYLEQTKVRSWKVLDTWRCLCQRCLLMKYSALSGTPVPELFFHLT